MQGCLNGTGTIVFLSAYEVTLKYIGKRNMYKTTIWETKYQEEHFWEGIYF